MAKRMRRVSLLGAFEIQAESEPPVRDGLILGSRREQRGFVLETSRENIEQIVSIVQPPKPGMPQRLTSALGKTLGELGYALVRVELIPLPLAAAAELEGYGSYVQGWLVFKSGERRLKRLAMTATESIQVALAENLPMLADSELLQLNMAQFIEELDDFSRAHREDTTDFRTFVNTVTASDFARFYESMERGKDDEQE
ncbi:MAG TPA: hypothetical protein V6D47_03350 [Oscillatoriaceae cyanobacterium]